MCHQMNNKFIHGNCAIDKNSRLTIGCVIDRVDNVYLTF